MFQDVKNEKGIIFKLSLSRYLDIYGNIIVQLEEMSKCIKFIEEIYPDTFNYRFNGSTIEILAFVPCYNEKLTSVFGRYGSVKKFYNILMAHLYNILNKNLNKNKTPSKTIPKCLIFKNFNVDNYNSTFINVNDNPKDIIIKSKHPINETIKTLDMKFWIKELNPDFMDYKKKPVIKNPIESDFNNYPQCIKNAMNLRYKSIDVRYLLMKYLLLTHKREDAKEIVSVCLDTKENYKMKFGTLKEKWDFAVSDLDNNTEPTCDQFRELKLCSECEKVCPYEVKNERRKIIE